MVIRGCQPQALATKVARDGALDLRTAIEYKHSTRWSWRAEVDHPGAKVLKRDGKEMCIKDAERLGDLGQDVLAEIPFGGPRDEFAPQSTLGPCACPYRAESSLDGRSNPLCSLAFANPPVASFHFSSLGSIIHYAKAELE